MAVMALHAYPPMALIVFRSACMPAPPQLSDPAIVNIVVYLMSVCLFYGVKLRNTSLILEGVAHKKF
jgi:hypothetical protein